MRGRGLTGKHFFNSNDKSIHDKTKRLYKFNTNRGKRNFNHTRQTHDDKRNFYKKGNENQPQKKFIDKRKNSQLQQKQARTGTSETPRIGFTELQETNSGITNNIVSQIASLSVSNTVSTFETKTISPIYIYSLSKSNRYINKNHNYVSFILDTGATKHITNSKIIFYRLESAKFNVIKCANKDSKADLIAEGKGQVYLITNKNKTIELTNAIYTNSVSENLLSLRRLAEAGYSTYFDNQCVNIFNSKTNEILATGIYKKPYWFLEIKIKKKIFNEGSVYPKMTAFDTTVVVETPEKINKIIYQSENNNCAKNSSQMTENDITNENDSLNKN